MYLQIKSKSGAWKDYKVGIILKLNENILIVINI